MIELKVHVMSADDEVRKQGHNTILSTLHLQWLNTKPGTFAFTLLTFVFTLRAGKKWSEINMFTAWFLFQGNLTGEEFLMNSLLNPEEVHAVTLTDRPHPNAAGCLLNCASIRPASATIMVFQIQVFIYPLAILNV